jgi:CHAT domain-containing protein/tetratricopeptide (TPR) repeat protein
MKSELKSLTALVVLGFLQTNLVSQAGQEPPPPSPRPDVQQILGEAATRSDPQEILSVAERALAAARQAADAPGLAAAERLRAIQLAALKRDAEALAAWREAEQAWARAGDGPGQIEAITRQALAASQPDTARIQSALAIAQAEKVRPRAAGALLVDLGRALLNRQQFAAATPVYDVAVPLLERVAPDSEQLARAIGGWANLTYWGGDLANAIARTERALQIFEKLSPGSLPASFALHNMGFWEKERGNLARSREYFMRAMAIQEKAAPDSLDLARTIHNLGTVDWREGNLDGAETAFLRALRIRERVAPPDAPDIPASYVALGNIASARGHHAAARDYYMRALTIEERTRPRSLEVLTALVGLGLVAYTEGDFAAARSHWERALTLQQAIAPRNMNVARIMIRLGALSGDMGDEEAARKTLESALAFLLKEAPETAEAADTLESLGTLAKRRDDMRAAADYFERSVKLRQQLVPESADMAVGLINLADMAWARGEHSSAKDLAARALPLAERASPESLNVAQVLATLAKYSQADLPVARRYATRAWAIVKAHAATVTGEEARHAFGARFAEVGSLLAAIQLAQGDPDAAFATVEEGRAQALLQLLAERSLAKTLVPADVWASYERARAAADRAGVALAEAGEAENKAKVLLDAEVAQLSGSDVVAAARKTFAERERTATEARANYTRARVEAEQRWADVRKVVTDFAPIPTGVAAARQALSGRTALVAFAVTDSGTTLFVVRREGAIQALPLSIGSKELAARVDLVRRTASREAGARGITVASDDEVRIRAARDLYQKIFPPAVRAALRDADRLILSPDGVLWDLPFAVLVTNAAGAPQYLGLEKPIVYTQSLATFAQTVSRRQSAAAKPLALVAGNPLLDSSLRGSIRPPAAPASATSGDAGRDKTSKRGDGELALLSREGTIPAPLPYAEEEAKRVAAVYGVAPAVADAPTEAWFRQRAAQADVIHLATHGYFNPFRAASSGVWLAVPERAPAPGQTDNDGALQAWEVMTQFKLRADLVVLSACETGLGSRVPGEGLVGLTRAFQVAGAATIVSTQWKVADRSTATAMLAMHQGLRKGLNKDEALRQAMRTVAGNPATAHPYYWAPFVLIGDFQPTRK